MSRLNELAQMLWDRRKVAATFAERTATGRVEGLQAAARRDAEALAAVHPDTLRVRLEQRRPASPTACRLRLVPLDGSFPPFRPGQYVNVHAEIDGVRTARPYSLCSSPAELDHVDLLVRHGPQGFVARWLAELPLGATLTVSAPAGDFGYDPLRDGDDLVLLAGGTGVAPALGILEHLHANASPAQALLLLGSRCREEILGAERLAELAAAHPGITVTHVLSEPDDDWPGLSGLLAHALLAGQRGARGPAGRTFFVCGPPAMTKLVTTGLGALGAPAHRVRAEPFGATADPTGLPGWPPELSPDTRFQVRLVGRGRVVEVVCGEPLLNALERAGEVVPSLCRVGSCGCCRSRLLAGRVLHAPSVKLRPSDEADAVVHPCCAYPLEDLAVELPGPRR